MANSAMKEAFQNLRRAMLIQDRAGLTDGELLTCFIEQHDEAAFETLVRRHGPMVLGVCRRVLRSQHDAEDAFQATFLVLVRKAASIVPRTMVGNWLYGVAHTTALRARAAIAKRRVKERKVMEMPRTEAAQQASWNDLQAVLDQELGRLPDKYRVPIILCDLENKSIKEAARHLGWPQGTVAGRLARGRKMLAGRMTQRGFALSGGMLATMLAQNALAYLPAALVSSTVKAASLYALGQAASQGAISAKVAALAEGVLKAMFMSKLKIATAVVLAAMLACCGIGVFTRSASAAVQIEPPTKAEPRVEKPAEAVKQKTLSIRADLEAVNPATHTVTASYWQPHEIKTATAPGDVEQKKARIFEFAQAKLVNLLVANDARIRDADKQIKLADLKAGTPITLELVAGQAGLMVVSIQKIDKNVPNRKIDGKMFPNGLRYDFGVLPRGLQPEYDFPIVNTSNAPLQLLSVRVSCGCMKASVSKELL